jgi:hypothetical protein
MQHVEKVASHHEEPRILADHFSLDLPIEIAVRCEVQDLIAYFDQFLSRTQAEI